MSEISIKIENVSKQYRLGNVGIVSMQEDIKRWWAKVQGKEDPNLKLGDSNIIGSKISIDDYVWALRDINLEINKGDVVGFIGKNGAGKSTLLKILSRVTAPTKGQIKVHGRIASLLEVGTGFHPELTGRENIFLNGAILGMTEAEIKRKFDEIVDFAGVERYIDTPVKRYSSGMYVRLAFAVAAHLEPEILIVDEVLAVGDAEFQKKALGKMNAISKDHERTVLFVSHSMAAMQNLCNKIVVMENGMAKFVGNVQEGIDFYLSKEAGNSLSEYRIEFSKNREGSGTVQFADFHIETMSGNKIDAALTGQDVVLVFTLKVNKAIANKVDIGFSFHNTQEEGLANLYSSYQKIVFNDLKQGYSVIKCKIKDFPFAPGRVLLKGRILENDREADWYKNPLGQIDIQMGDFYKTGVVGQANWGHFLIKGEWSKQS
jgi:lipopolysaccharide transport system ATP-binding protein